MNSTLDQIRTRIGKRYVVSSCKEAGCKASLDGIPQNRLLIDANKALPAHGYHNNCCDCILFFIGDRQGLIVVVPIELKSGRVDVSQACQQLKSGTEFAESMLCPIASADCQPVLIHGKKLHTHDLKKLNKTKLHFRGQELTIKVVKRCKRLKNLVSILEMPTQL